MNKAIFCLLGLLPFAPVLAADPPAESAVPVIRIDNKDIALEDLAHSFLSHISRASEMLKLIISEEGVNRLGPEIAELRRDMNDTRKIAVLSRQVCSDLQSARSGSEFAAVFVRGEEKERIDAREAAGRILSKLEDYDRKALEEYLETRFRAGYGRSQVDWEAMFTSGPFPSARTAEITRRTCDSAAEAETRLEPGVDNAPSPAPPQETL